MSETNPTSSEPRLQKALNHLASLLVPNETVQCFAVQRRLFALVHRRTMVAATSGRFIGMTRGLIAGFTPYDVRWQDIKNAQVRTGIFGATLKITALSQPDLAISGATRTIEFIGLRKADAQAVYRICQAQEQAWREKRRQRELEELRAKSGGFVGSMGAGARGSESAPASAEDATVRLQRAKDMLSKGLISDSEYETIKARIVNEL